MGLRGKVSTEDNKHLVRRWFDAVNHGSEQDILALLADDFEFKAMARRPEWIRYRWGREEFAAAPKAMSIVLKSTVVMEIVGMIEQDSTVAVEAQAECTEGCSVGKEGVRKWRG